MKKVQWEVRNSFNDKVVVVDAATPESALNKAHGPMPGAHAEVFDGAVPKWVSVWGVYEAKSERGTFVVGFSEHG